LNKKWQNGYNSREIEEAIDLLKVVSLQTLNTYNRCIFYFDDYVLEKAKALVEDE